MWEMYFLKERKLSLLFLKSRKESQLMLRCPISMCHTLLQCYMLDCLSFSFASFYSDLSNNRDLGRTEGGKNMAEKSTERKMGKLMWIDYKAEVGVANLLRWQVQSTSLYSSLYPSAKIVCCNVVRLCMCLCVRWPNNLPKKIYIIKKNDKENDSSSSQIGQHAWWRNRMWKSVLDNECLGLLFCLSIGCLTLFFCSDVSLLRRRRRLFDVWSSLAPPHLNASAPSSSYLADQPSTLFPPPRAPRRLAHPLNIAVSLSVKSVSEATKSASFFFFPFWSCHVWVCVCVCVGA